MTTPAVPSQYEVDGHKTTFKTFKCFAASPHEAVCKFRESNPEFRADTVSAVSQSNATALEVLGACEGCGSPILESDQYNTDQDGVYLCCKCSEEMAPQHSGVLTIGSVYKTPFEPHGLFRVLYITPPNPGYLESASGVFVGDHPCGYKDGSPGRYLTRELAGREVPDPAPTKAH